LATSESASEGYLLERGDPDISNRASLTDTDLLNISRSKNKPELSIDAASRLTGTNKIYEIMENGKVHSRIPSGSPLWNMYFRPLSRLPNDLFANDYDVKKVDVFFNGFEIRLADLLSDLNDKYVADGRQYLSGVKPALVNGQVEYVLKNPATSADIKISTGLDEFLKKTKVLYDNDENAVREIIMDKRVVRKTAMALQNKSTHDEHSIMYN
jgi:hypothetical protein